MSDRLATHMLPPSNRGGGAVQGLLLRAQTSKKWPNIALHTQREGSRGQTRKPPLVSHSSNVTPGQPARERLGTNLPQTTPTRRFSRTPRHLVHNVIDPSRLARHKGRSPGPQTISLCRLVTLGGEQNMAPVRAIGRDDDASTRLTGRSQIRHILCNTYRLKRFSGTSPLSTNAHGYTNPGTSICLFYAADS